MTDKFCKFCGTAHTAPSFPMLCDSCQNTTWSSPWPVAINLQPVQLKEGRGLLIGRRTIEPNKGGWNLIGGFVDAGDKTAQAAAAREMFEETGIEIEDPDSMDIVGTFNDGRHFLIFVENYNAFEQRDLAKFKANDECDEIRVIFEPENLCFQSHTDAANRWFELDRILDNSIDEDHDEGGMTDYEDQDEDDDDWRN